MIGSAVRTGEGPVKSSVVRAVAEGASCAAATTTSASTVAAATAVAAPEVVVVAPAVLGDDLGRVRVIGVFGPRGLGKFIALVVGALLVGLLARGILIGVVAVAPAATTPGTTVNPGVPFVKVSGIIAPWPCTGRRRVRMTTTGTSKGEETSSEGGSRVVVDALARGPVGIKGLKEVPEVGGLLVGGHVDLESCLTEEQCIWIRDGEIDC